MSDNGENDTTYLQLLKEHDTVNLDEYTFAGNVVFCAVGSGSGCLMAGMLANRFNTSIIIAVTINIGGKIRVGDIFKDAKCINDGSKAGDCVWYIPGGSRQAGRPDRPETINHYRTHDFIEKVTRDLNIGVVWVVPKPGAIPKDISNLITAGLDQFGSPEPTLVGVNQGMNIYPSNGLYSDELVFDALMCTNYPILMLIIGMGTDGRVPMQKLLSEWRKVVSRMSNTHNVGVVEDTKDIINDITSEMQMSCPAKGRTYNYFAEAIKLHECEPTAVIQVPRPWHMDGGPTYPVEMLKAVFAFTPKPIKSARKR
jgi:hypothetical protein